MDLNYLLHRQQVERCRAASASCAAARRAHAQLAGLYEEAIERRTKAACSFHRRTSSEPKTGRANFAALREFVTMKSRSCLRQNTQALRHGQISR